MATGKIFTFMCFIILLHRTTGNDSGLYFQLNGKIYLPGAVIKLTDIGEQPASRSNPGSTLVCMTENVNTACCRYSDGARVGSWYYPNNGTEVPRRGQRYSGINTIIHSQQIRLVRHDTALGPFGNYTCSVPDPAGNIWNASIYLSGNDSGLYFQLNGKIYLPGAVIKLTDIGKQPPSRSNPGSTLVCMTENVNTACCRYSDGARVGSWYYPNNGTEVPRRGQRYSAINTIIYSQQIRLMRHDTTLGPFGNYTCSVPDPAGNIWNASIYLSEQINTSLTSTKELLKPGGLVTFTCFIMKTGIGTQITLLRPDGSYVKSSTPDIAVDDQQDNTRVYTIASVKPSHAGLYSCLAHDGINTYVPSTKELYVQLQTPLSVLFLPLQPIYATSSTNIYYHIQLLNTLDVPSYFNIQWTTPTNSTQVLQDKNVSTLGRNYYEGFISLQNVRIEDQGKYTCKVQMISPKQYIVASNFSMGVINIKIKDTPSIRVFVIATKKAELNSLYLLICYSRTSEINFIYASKFQWYHNGVVLVGRTTRVLHLSSLSLSDVGNHTCRVTATSRILGQPIIEESQPHMIILRAPNPVSLQLSATPPSVVFQGSSLQLTCIILYSLNVNVNMTVNTELHGPSITMTREAAVMSTNRYEASFIINNTTSKHTGNYSCSAVASGISISRSAMYTSNTLQINAVGPPLAPILCDVGRSDTYIHITWIIPEKDKVEYFQLHYSYTIRGCEGLTGTNYFVLSNNTQSYNLTNLEENSDFFITLSAVNQAGKSNPAIIRTYTLPAAPTTAPTNIRPITVTSTSISITWDPIPCSYRNTNVTGYNVTHILKDVWFFFVTTNLGITDIEYMKATGLIPGTSYTFVVTPIHDFYESPHYNGVVTLNTTLSKGLGFSINGLLLPNNSVIEASDIGMDNKALFCITNLAKCCKRPYSNYLRGNWIFPDNTRVPTKWYRYIFSRTRLSSSVILHHNNSIHGYNDPSGVFTCKIPDSDEKYQNLYIHIAENFSDIYISEINYNRQFMYLTCASSGRPVNSWEWLKDGMVINKSDSSYNQTQVITNYTTPTYVHSLSSEDMFDTKGRFTCLVRDSEGNTDQKTIMINNCPPGKYGAVAFDGSTVCVPCPANSMSTSVGSNGCGCLLGCYRNHLEDNHFPCTRPPSNCRGLRVKEESHGSAVLEWSRPYIPGRPDLYYDVYIKDSELSEKYMKSNSYPVVSDSAKVQYALTGLLPLTNYEMKVCVNNGVSGSYESAEQASCEVSWTTSNNSKFIVSQ